MNIGKVPENVLVRSVLKPLNTVNKANKAENLLIGLDAGSINNSETDNKISVATVFGEAVGNGKLAVYRAVNNLAVSGAKATGITVSVLVSEAHGEAVLKSIMQEIAQTAAIQKISILMADAGFINGETVITVNAVGKSIVGKSTGAAIKEGSLVMFGNAGNIGAAMLCREYYSELSKRFNRDFLSKALAGAEMLDISTKALELMTECNNVILHNVSEGGVFGAAWELCERLNMGCSIDLFKIPVNQAIIEVCEFLDINPYILRGDGAFLAAVAGSCEEVVTLAEKYGGTVLGTLNKNKDRILKINEEIRQMEPNRYEEYYRVHK